MLFETAIFIGLSAADPAALAKIMPQEKQATVMLFGLNLHRDFGTVGQGTKATCRFRMTNHTKEPIELTRVAVSAGYVRGTIAAAKKLALGESTELVVEIDTSRFEGRKTVSVAVNYSGKGTGEKTAMVSVSGVSVPLRLKVN